jgi:hypothetical protein
MKKLVRIAGLILCAVSGVAIVSAVLSFTQIGSCGGTGNQVCPAGVGTDVLKIVGGSMALALGAVLTLGAGVLVACVTAAVALIVKGHGSTPMLVGVGLIVLSAAIFLLELATKRAAIARATRAAEMTAPDPFGTDPTLVGVTEPGPADAVPTSYTSAAGSPYSSGPEGITSNVPVAGRPVANAPVEGGIVTSLERLAALRQNGSLSDYEYTLAKQRLLNGE